jgi:signal peptidase I
MKNHHILWGFLATVAAAVLLRVFVIDIISVSNDILQPTFYPGDLVLISKIVTPMEGDWALLKNQSDKTVYSLRRLIKRGEDQTWEVLEPGPSTETKNVSVDRKNVLGKAVVILWSLPCKPTAVVNHTCPDKTGRFFKKVF